ncbi:MAG: PilZ domain-containing protein [Bryobacteraceae bacterium]
MAGNLAKLASALSRAGGAKKQASFQDRRSEQRLWCSDLVTIWWKEDDKRWKRRGVGVLEDISPSGACIQLEEPLPKGVRLRIKHPEWKVEGEIRYCVFREEGYFLGVLLDENSKWSRQAFKPKHLIDPAKVPQPKKK